MALRRDYLTLPEAAWLMHRSERDIRRHIDAGTVAVVEPRVGNSIRICAGPLGAKLRLRASWWLGELLDGRAAAPRSNLPWKVPPALPRCGAEVRAAAHSDRKTDR
jgi:hypothetical protein